MSQPASLITDRAISLAFAALAPLALMVAGFWIWPGAGEAWLQAFRGYAAMLLTFYAGLHWGYALWQRGDAGADAKPNAEALLLRYLPLLPVGWLATLLPATVGLVLSLAAFAWAYLAGSAIQRVAPDWLQRLRQRVVWVAAVCHLAALAWLARSDYLGG